MASATEQIAAAAHVAQEKYLAFLKPEERLKLERATKIGRIVRSVPESRMAQMLSTGHKYRVVA